MMKEIRRKDREIVDSSEMKQVLRSARFVTLAMCMNGEPYLATLSHGYDEERNCIYFHCAGEGKKIDILRANNLVWGQALIDHGYVQGACDHLYSTTQFRGRVTFVEDLEEKRHALQVMIESLDYNLLEVMKNQIKPKSVQRVTIGRIDIYYMSGKKADKVVISQ